jgi:hypothetical protein
MICVSVKIREGALTHPARVTAPSIEGALEIAGGKRAIGGLRADRTL